MRKLWLVLIVAVIALAGCSSGGGKETSGTNDGQSQKQPKSGGGESIELEFWTINLKEGFNDFFVEKFAKYEADHPGVKIKWIDVPDFDKTDTKLLAAISGGNVPDVVNLTPFMIPKFVRSGALANIDDIQSGVGSQFVPAFWDAGVIDGKPYGIPFYGSVPGVFVNAKIFEAAGLDPNKPPASWEQVVEYSKIVKEKTGIAGNMQTIDNFADSGNPIDMLARRGVKIMSDDGKKAAFNTPEGAKVLQEFVDMYKNGSMHPDSLTGTMMDAGARFAEGKVAMIFPGPWMYRWIKDNSSAETFNNVKIYPGIIGNEGKLNSFLQTFVIPAKSKHPKEALELAVYFSGTLNDFVKLAPVAPTITSLLDDPYFTEGPPEIKIIKDGLPKAKFYWPLVPGLTEMIEVLRNEFQRAALNNVDPLEALNSAAEQWNQILAK